MAILKNQGACILIFRLEEELYFGLIFYGAYFYRVYFVIKLL